MRTLIVEDDESNIALFISELAKYGVETVFARSRDSALSAIRAAQYDLIIIDLKIPTQDGGLDAEINHGLAVHSFVQDFSRGTPIIVFSAFGTVPVVADLCENCNRHDIWGNGSERSMTIFKDKSNFAECLAEAKHISDEIATLNSIDISMGLRQIDLSSEHKRILRVFARIFNGVNIRINQLGGGLSSAKTLSLEVKDAHGTITSYAMGKLDSIDKLWKERYRYQNYVAPILRVGDFAHEIRFLQSGAGNIGGLFYGLAQEYDDSLLGLLKHNPEKAVEIVRELQRLEANWYTTASTKPITIGEIRQSLIPDDEFLKYESSLAFNWKELEKMRISIKSCRQHRDLHGLNVLVRNSGTPLLIDFGEVDIAPACLDPLTLEMSLLFHPICKEVRGGWPSLDQAKSWTNITEYVANSPFASFIHACRDWSFSVQESDKGVFATAYAYAVRQHKYPDTDHELATTLARAFYNKLTE